MGPLQGRRFSRRGGASSQGVAPAPSLRLFIRDMPDELGGRHEPQALTARACPPDPYVAWLAEREADQAREEGSSIRWIHRPRHLDGPVVGVRVPAGQQG